MKKTRIIAVEGIDGSGKTLQVERLCGYLRAKGSVSQKSFPVYGSFFGRMIGGLLKGEELSAADVDAKSMCLWYALDRWEDFKDYKDGESDFLVINRYVLSNAAYQSSRERDIGNADICDWVFELEYGKLALPKPDICLVLDVAPANAGENIDKKGFRDYIGNERDSYEKQGGLQARVRAKYLEMSKKDASIAVIDCMEGERLAAPEKISQRIISVLETRGIVHVG